MVAYLGQRALERLLGTHGAVVLEQVLALVQRSASEFRWPLSNIEVRHTCEPEVEGWEYVLIVLGFNAPFEKADKLLHLFYAQLDAFSEQLDFEDKRLVRRLFFFDVQTPARVPSS